MLIGYARVSTDDQDTAAQVAALQAAGGEARSMRVTSNELAAKVACSFGHRSRQRRAFPNQKTNAADRPLESPYWGKATSGGADTPEKGSMKRRHLFDSRNQDVI